MSLVQLFYVRRANRYDGEGIEAILNTSRRNNRRDDVTGCLLFSGRYFAQVLEGSSNVTTGRLDQISRDPRHVDVRLLVERPIILREYGDWSMGYLHDHDHDLEDELERLLPRPSSPPERVVSIMDHMKPDTIMGALSTSFSDRRVRRWSNPSSQSWSDARCATRRFRRPKETWRDMSFVSSCMV